MVQTPIEALKLYFLRWITNNRDDTGTYKAVYYT